MYLRVLLRKIGIKIGIKLGKFFGEFSGRFLTIFGRNSRQKQENRGNFFG